MLTAAEIKERLECIEPSYIDITEDSQSHAEHIENPTGGLTHATITLVSKQFEGLSLINRHKLVYSQLKDALASSLHALVLKTYTEEEFESKSSK